MHLLIYCYYLLKPCFKNHKRFIITLQAFSLNPFSKFYSVSNPVKPVFTALLKNFVRTAPAANQFEPTQIIFLPHLILFRSLLLELTPDPSLSQREGSKKGCREAPYFFSSKTSFKPVAKSFTISMSVLYIRLLSPGVFITVNSRSKS